MRARVLVPALLALLASASAQAAVQIDINKDTQTMTVAVDGDVRDRWPVSSGLPAEAQRKFGGDSLAEFVRNAESFRNSLG